MKREHTWCVWWRYILSSGTKLAYNDKPKLYYTEKAARMAERDLNKFYDFGVNGRLEYIALPIGVNPYDQ
ncbi:hypothetical protein [Ralstonia phage RP13]|nr:hypothetical protein [Ralstonia phage RP13]